MRETLARLQAWRWNTVSGRRAPAREVRDAETPPVSPRRDAGGALEQPPKECGALVADPPGDLIDRRGGPFEPALVTVWV